MKYQAISYVFINKNTEENHLRVCFYDSDMYTEDKIKELIQSGNLFSAPNIIDISSSSFNFLKFLILDIFQKSEDPCFSEKTAGLKNSDIYFSDKNDDDHYIN